MEKPFFFFTKETSICSLPWRICFRLIGFTVQLHIHEEVWIAGIPHKIQFLRNSENLLKTRKFKEDYETKRTIGGTSSRPCVGIFTHRSSRFVFVSFLFRCGFAFGLIWSFQRFRSQCGPVFVILVFCWRGVLRLLP